MDKPQVRQGKYFRRLVIIGIFPRQQTCINFLKPGKMQSLSETEWDVVISGTGLQQSLLAL
jgi:hypothetical protein